MPGNFIGLTQNYTPKLKFDIKLFVDSENFMKNYRNLIEIYCFERNQFREFVNFTAKIYQNWDVCPNMVI